MSNKLVALGFSVQALVPGEWSGKPLPLVVTLISFMRFSEIKLPKSVYRDDFG